MTEVSTRDPEERAAARLAHLLTHDSEPLSNAVRERLRAARRIALNHQRAPSAGLSLAGIGREIEDFWFQRGRAMVMALALLALLGASDYWGQRFRVSELEDVDSALLSDDLPIDAYLDHGFDQWLKSEPGSGS